MTKDQIKHMVDRFLMWRLPKPWNPDNGISYKRPNFAHAPADHDWPIGTNLFSATEAEAMVRHMLEGLPAGRDTTVAADRLMRADDAELETILRHDPSMIRDVAAALVYERYSSRRSPCNLEFRASDFVWPEALR